MPSFHNPAQWILCIMMLEVLINWILIYLLYSNHINRNEMNLDKDKLLQVKKIYIYIIYDTGGSD